VDIGFGPSLYGSKGEAEVVIPWQEHTTNSITSRQARAPTLRPYQIDIIDQVRLLDRPLIPLPTGGGKTVIAAAIIEEAIRLGLHVLFVGHLRELVIQASRKLLAVGVDHAILMGAESSKYLGQRCIVASIQTLYARGIRNERIDPDPLRARYPQ
jgi:superfamily II DNA or RNA helicase